MMFRSYGFEIYLIVCLFVALFLLQDANAISAGENENYRLKRKKDRLDLLIKNSSSDISKAIELDRSAAKPFKARRKEEASRLLDQGLLSMNKYNSNKYAVLSVAKRERTNSRMNSKLVELSIDVPEVTATGVVPSFDSGKDVNSKLLSSAFNKSILPSSNGKVRLQLTSTPVIVEEGVSPISYFPKSKYLDSPFGIHDFIPRDFQSLKDLGVHWGRYPGKHGIVWGIVEPRKGKFNWFENDRLYLKTYEEDINMLVNISVKNQWDQSSGLGRFLGRKIPPSKFPVHLDAYIDFLRKTIERYDGDGIDDAPGSPVVKYWMLENEPDFFWKDTPENFAKLVKISYQTIKKANRNAKVVMAGAATPKGFQEFYIPMLKHLDKIKDKYSDTYFDIFEFHWWVGGTGGYKVRRDPDGTKTNLKQYVATIRNTLEKYNYDVPIWITEMASHSGNPKREIEMGYPVSVETERQQADELVKRYVYSLSLGIKKVFWVTVTEFHDFEGKGPDTYFNHVGLINNPKNDGKSHKKLSYYSYKLLVDKLEGVELDKVETLHLGEDIFAYRFYRGGHKVYVLWSE